MTTHDVFSNINNSDQAFWYGFLAARATISRPGNGGNYLVVHDADMERLITLRDFLGSENKIQFNRHTLQTTLRVGSKQICLDVEHGLGTPPPGFVREWAQGIIAASGNTYSDRVVIRSRDWDRIKLIREQFKNHLGIQTAGTNITTARAGRPGWYRLTYDAVDVNHFISSS